MYDFLPFGITADVVVGLDDIKSIDGDADDGADVENVDDIHSLITMFSNKAMFITRFYWSIVETKEVYSRAKHAKRIIHMILLMRVPLRLKILISFKYLNIWIQIIDLV